MPFKTYEEYAQTREKIMQYLVEMRQPLEKIGLSSRAQVLQGISQRLRNDTFKVMVLGEFKRGKSTFVNALLGANILPAKVPPCTAVITEVKYGEKPKAILHYTDPQHPPQEIDIKDIGKFIVIKEDDANKEPTLEKRPYKKLEVFYPLPLCQNNVEIIDSPGLNENETRQSIVEDYIGRLDAGILVLSCRQFFSKSEQRFLEQYTSADQPVLSRENFFLVANYFDAIAGEAEEVEEIKQRRDKYLGKIFVGQKIHHFFFLSAKQGLDAKMSPNQAALDQSGLPEVEKALEQFLSQDRGKIKIARAIRDIRAVLREGVNYFPSFMATLQQDVSVLEQKMEEIRPRLEKLRSDKRRLASLIELHGKASCQDVTAVYKNLKEELIDQLYSFVQAYKAKVSCIRVKKYVEEIQIALQDKTEEIIQMWKEKELVPIFNNKSKELEAELESYAQEFLTEIESIRSFISGVPTVPEEKRTILGDISALSRILAGAGGLILGGSGGFILGSALGFKELLKNYWVHLIDVTVCIVLFWASPIGLLVVFAYRFLLCTPFHKDITKAVENEIKQKIIASFGQNLQAAMVKAQQEMMEKMMYKFVELQQNITNGLQLLIDDVEGQLAKAIEERKSKRNKIEELNTVMQQNREFLLKLDEKLEDEYEKAVC